MVTILSPPLALNGETLRQRIDERVDHTLGEASEEVQACGVKVSILLVIQSDCALVKKLTKLSPV